MKSSEWLMFAGAAASSIGSFAGFSGKSVGPGPGKADPKKKALRKAQRVARRKNRGK